MDRRFSSKTFASCTDYLGKEVTEIDTIKQSLNSALSADGSSEFSDDYLRIQYNSILESMNEKRSSLVEHQIYLGKRKAYINNDDTSNAQKMDDLLAEFSLISTSIEEFAQEVNASALELTSGNISLDAIISLEELEVASDINEALGDITYEDYCNMSAEERDVLVNNAISLANQYIINGTLVIPENGRVELPIAPGITIYCTGKFNTAISDDNAAVDWLSTARESCLHIMGEDEFAGLDVSLDSSLQAQVTNTTQIDDNTSIYVSAGYNISTQSIYIERGVNISSDPVEVGDDSVSSTVSAACGVQIYEPSPWKHEPDFVKPPLYNEYQQPIVWLQLHIPIPVPVVQAAGTTAQVVSETVQSLSGAVSSGGIPSPAVP